MEQVTNDQVQLKKLARSLVNFNWHYSYQIDDPVDGIF